MIRFRRDRMKAWKPSTFCLLKTVNVLVIWHCSPGRSEIHLELKLEAIEPNGQPNFGHNKKDPRDRDDFRLYKSYAISFECYL